MNCYNAETLLILFLVNVDKAFGESRKYDLDSVTKQDEEDPSSAYNLVIERFRLTHSNVQTTKKSGAARRNPLRRELVGTQTIADNPPATRPSTNRTACDRKAYTYVYSDTRTDIRTCHTCTDTYTHTK